MATVSTSIKTTTRSGTTIDAVQNKSLIDYPVYGSDGYAYLFGGDTTDKIFGSSGNDKIFGGGGDDILYGGDGSDFLSGDFGNDWLLGENGSDALFGSSGKDILSGGDGNDLLNGGSGKDFLYGGKGADVFEFAFISDSMPSQMDIIDDYNKLEGDIIDLSKIDAMEGGTSNDAFHWVSTITESNANGAVWLQGNTIFASTDMDTAAEFAITVYGVSSQLNVNIIL